MRITKPHTQVILYATATVCLVIAAVAFTVAVTSALHTGNRIAHDERVHCLADTRQDNARRALDLALIASDRHILTAMAAFHPVTQADRQLAAVITGHFRLALRARLANVPPYVSPARC